MTDWRALFTVQISEKFGYVNTVEDADRLLKLFFVSTTSRFVTNKVQATHFGKTDFKSKPHKLIWESEATKYQPAITYDGTPFMKVNLKMLNCQFGIDKSVSRKRKLKAKKEEDEANGIFKKSRNRIFCKKRNCPANVALSEIIRFPDFTLEVDSAKSRRQMSEHFLNSIQNGNMKIDRRIFITLPEQTDHKFHPFTSELFVPLKYSRKPGMLAALASSTGRVEDISVSKIPDLETAGDNMVLIKVYASAVNRDDIDRRKSFTSAEEPHVLGYEAAGIVIAAGCGSKWSLGERVMAYLPGGGCAEQVIAHQDHVMLVPRLMTLSSAAAIPQAWVTAYHLLYHVACMKAGDIVLIHAGASGVGTALVQLVTMAGGCAIVTAGSQGKIDLCKSLGASAGFCYKSLDVRKDIASYLEGRGVNLIFDCVAGIHWQLNSNFIATNGTWIIYGLISGPFIAGDMRPLLTKNVTIKTSSLRSHSHEYVSELIASFTKKVLPYFQPNSEYELSPVINKYYKLDKIIDAHKFLESNQNIGKVIISIREEVCTEIEQKEKEIDIAHTVQRLSKSGKEIIIKLENSDSFEKFHGEVCEAQTTSAIFSEEHTMSIEEAADTQPHDVTQAAQKKMKHDQKNLVVLNGNNQDHQSGSSVAEVASIAVEPQIQ
ncbi:uncharacterized protein LOC117120373 [Anneissia japonica]|uniref:uncharacterized protein LOC117120373 n=1 Tax=Anneissia japonica TaxID=1529436 RepID=UPI001425717E|nr:uncharacterized protein LOC117120373 [Anneissia japonica]